MLTTSYRSKGFQEKVASYIVTSFSELRFISPLAKLKFSSQISRLECLTITHSRSVIYIDCRSNYITNCVRHNSSSQINSNSASQELCHSV